MAAQQAPLSLGFSRQEPWSGLPFPSPMRESEVAQSYLTPSDPMDCSLPGSSIHGICQARVLEWGAIAFSRIPFFLKNGWLSFCVVLAPLNTLFFVSNILPVFQGHFEFWCNILANGYPLSEIFRSFYHPGLQ